MGGEASEKFCSDFSLPHCHHHGPQGNDPYPAEGTAGCPQQSSPQCPRKCDAGASSDHSDFSSDKYTFTGGTQSASGEQEIQQDIMAGGPVEGGHAVRIVGWGVENGNKYWKVAN